MLLKHLNYSVSQFISGMKTSFSVLLQLCCVTLGMLLNLSETHLLHMSSKDNQTYFIGYYIK